MRGDSEHDYKNVDQYLRFFSHFTTFPLWIVRPTRSAFEDSDRPFWPLE